MSVDVGAKAPDFTLHNQDRQDVTLSEELKKGPVVIYFFPKAFTQGCTLEAHAFSDAASDFRKAGARVIGLSADRLPTLKKFSAEACRNAFPVATATPAVIRAYDVKLKLNPAMTDRTSYVIAPDGRIIFVHSELNWAEHVAKTLAAVNAFRAKR